MWQEFWQAVHYFSRFKLDMILVQRSGGRGQELLSSFFLSFAYMCYLAALPHSSVLIVCSLRGALVPLELRSIKILNQGYERRFTGMI
jgi:hypothetical protein